MNSEKQCVAAILNIPFLFDKNENVNITKTLKKLKPHLTAFCESILLRVDEETDFYLINYSDKNNPKPYQFIIGEEIAPFTSNLIELTFEVAEKLEFLKKSNFNDFTPNGEEGIVIFMRINGNFHWDHNFLKASQYMGDMNYSVDSYFKLFGNYNYDDTEYFIQTSYENGDFEDGFMPYFFQSGYDMYSEDVSQWCEDAAYKDLEYYSLTEEMFNLEWFKEKN